MLKRTASTIICLFGLLAAPASAAERLCDPAFENCRVPLMTLIQNERVGIDVGFWFMEDYRYVDAIIAKFKSGVPVRLIVDTRANETYTLNGTILQKFAAAGIPMRRAGSLWLHWKMMIFAGQNVVEFSGANYSPHAFVPELPYANYIDEVVYFCDDLDVVNSFKTRFDDVWMSSSYINYANITSLTRHYPRHTFDPELNFVPLQNYALRLVPKYSLETRQIDITMYRITDRRHTDALIAARQRGVRVRLLTEPKEYRNPKRLWHSWNIDRLYMAGAEIMHREHLGLNHQKSLTLHSLGLSVLGSSNWTSGSAGLSEEHNYFTTKPWVFDWLNAQFERKWNNSTGIVEYKPFQPLPPTRPVAVSPLNGAVGQSTSMKLVWNGGPYAHNYDVYFGTTPDPPLLAANLELGPSETTASRHNKSFVLPTLSPGTTYYWRIVGRTMAEMTKGSLISSFTTGGTSQGGPINGTLGADDINLYARDAQIPSGSAWRLISDASAAGGTRIAHPNQNAAKISTALASPTHYFELTFSAQQGRAYRLWIRGRAESNYWANDSVFVQFSGSVNASGAPVYRIDTTSGTDVNLEDCGGCGLSGWGWQDNGWGVGVLGTTIYFETTGTQRIRVQTREDGFSIDQILLSPAQYMNSAPGALKSDTTILPQNSGGSITSSTGGTPPPATGAGDINLYARDAQIASGSAWRLVSDATAAGGVRIANPNLNAAKVTVPLESPTDHFDVDESGNTINRIGTTSAVAVNLEDCSGCGLSGWGWQDNGWGVAALGPLIYFGETGPQTIRVPTREDGFSIDQIMLSADLYLNSAPGALRSDTTILPQSSGV